MNEQEAAVETERVTLRAIQRREAREWAAATAVDPAAVRRFISDQDKPWPMNVINKMRALALLRHYVAADEERIRQAAPWAVVGGVTCCDVCQELFASGERYVRHSRLGVTFHATHPLDNIKGENVAFHAMEHGVAS